MKWSTRAQASEKLGEYWHVFPRSGLSTSASTCRDRPGDGYVDLYVVNNGTANVLFRNLGDGSFLDQASSLGVQDTAGAGRAGIAVDIDADGDLDIYVVSDGSANMLYRNDGGVFTESASAMGVQDAGGAGRAAIAGDFDGLLGGGGGS